MSVVTDLRGEGSQVLAALGGAMPLFTMHDSELSEAKSKTAGAFQEMMSKMRAYADEQARRIVLLETRVSVLEQENLASREAQKKKDASLLALVKEQREEIIKLREEIRNKHKQPAAQVERKDSLSYVPAPRMTSSIAGRFYETSNPAIINALLVSMVKEINELRFELDRTKAQMDRHIITV